MDNKLFFSSQFVELVFVKLFTMKLIKELMYIFDP